jgi:hypothetical protein
MGFVAGLVHGQDQDDQGGYHRGLPQLPPVVRGQPAVPWPNASMRRDKGSAMDMAKNGARNAAKW